MTERRLREVLLGMIVLVLFFWAMDVTDPTGDGMIDTGRIDPCRVTSTSLATCKP